MKKWFKRILIIFSSIFIGLLVLYLLRVPILRTIGNILIYEDHPVKVDAAFILSGASYERGIKAVKLYKEGFIPVLIPTGGIISGTLKAAGIEMTDAELTQKVLISEGVDSSAIHLLQAGSSTFEESEEILGYSIQRGYSRIMIISSKFHTRRIKSVFTDKFEEANIAIVVVGSEPQTYDTNQWWLSEEGLLFVNNEYVKSVYYWLKY